MFDKQDMEYKNMGQKNSFTIFKGTVKKSDKKYDWIGAFKSDGQTTSDITVSLPIENGNANLNIFNAIINSLK